MFGVSWPNAASRIYVFDRVTGEKIAQVSYRGDRYKYDVWKQAALGAGDPVMPFLGWDEDADAPVSRLQRRITPESKWVHEFDAAITGVSMASNVVVTTLGTRLVGFDVYTGEQLFDYETGIDLRTDDEILGTPIPTDGYYLLHTFGGQLVAIEGDPIESPTTSAPTTTQVTTTAETTSEAAMTTRSRGDETTAGEPAEQSSEGVPGFGVGASALGVGAGLAAARRYSGSRRDDSE